MFQDFDKSKEADQGGRGRTGVSMAISLVIFGLFAALIATAMATAHAVVQSRPRDVDVEFAQLPQPEPELEPPPPPPPPPPPIKRARTRRPAADRENLGPPDEIPDEQPEEAEGELVEAGEVGPVDGFIDGGGDGESDAPARPPVPSLPPPTPSPRQERETISRPSFLSGCRTPEVPDSLLGQAATIRIEVRMLIGPDGRVVNAAVTEGHALVPDEVILRCARDQVFEPASLPDGTPVPFPFRRRFVFRPANL